MLCYKILNLLDCKISEFISENNLDHPDDYVMHVQSELYSKKDLHGPYRVVGFTPKMVRVDKTDPFLPRPKHRIGAYTPVHAHKLLVVNDILKARGKL